MNKTRMSAEAFEAIERQKTLLEISRLYDPNFNRTWESITEIASPVLNADRASIWSLSKDSSRLICKDIYIRSSSDHASRIELKCNLYPTYINALETSRFIDASDGVNDPRTSEFTIGYLNPLNIKSLLDVPIWIEGKLSGVLCFEYLDKIHTWSLEEKEFAASLADLVSAKFEALERSRAEIELSLSEKRYQNILDNALIGIFRSKPDGTFLFGNPAIATILEFDSVNDLLQINTVQLYHSRQDRKRMIDQIRQKTKLRDFELTLVSNKGNLRNCMINAYLEEGEIAGMMIDVTEQKRILKDLEEARKRAEESDRLKTSLLANMSHELRTPMNSILGFSELLLNDSKDPETLFYSKKILGSGKRLMNTLQAILELADMETTRSKILFKEVDLHEVLSSVLSPFQPQASEKGLYLMTEIDTRHKAWGDENLLKLVFQNLIDNAFKFTIAGGITVETTLKKSDGENWALIRFKDTGIGIDSESFEQIFQEFRQASEGYDRRYEGTGLGLTLSNKMIQLMGGKITIESKVGLGSTFTVWLSVLSAGSKPTDKAMSQSQESQVLPVQETPSLQELPVVLVVEDNEDNAEIVKLFLKSKYRIDRASDRTTALKMAENKQYKAVLLDINLGIGMNGLQIVRELRSQKSYQNTPIIAITGYTMAEDRDKIMSAGCSHYIAKPFTKSIIVNVMAQAMQCDVI